MRRYVSLNVIVAVILYTFFDLEGNPEDRSLDEDVICKFLDAASASVKQVSCSSYRPSYRCCTVAAAGTIYYILLAFEYFFRSIACMSFSAHCMRI